MFSVAAAPAPAAMQTIAISPPSGVTDTGALRSPTAAVKTTSDITRGFISAR